MEFSADEIERYARHLVLPEVGGPGQQRLKRSRLLVIGAGGLGTPVIAYAAAAGVGHIGVVDFDGVSLANLQRQIIFGTDDVGSPKAERAADAVRRINPHITVEPIATKASAANLAGLVAGYDIVADCTDNAEARYAVSDACFHAARTLVTAAVIRLDGSVTTLKPHERDADGAPNPTYRCLFPEPPADGTSPGCAELGVLGPLAGVVGTLQALEVVKELAGIGSSLVGRLLLIDGRDLRMETISYAWNPANPLNGRAAASRAMAS
ncbi:MAG: molybdopterin-synthase adenylyltransferase MoeB [Bauldia sp.]|nr:molybdopterin-synthase adenylyltransferase MoeB [Bauldia sp.]